jgi:hypothetical protein
MNDDDKNLIKDTINTPGWALLKALNDNVVKGYRIHATARELKMEDRLWYSALALGREELIAEIESKVVE